MGSNRSRFLLTTEVFVLGTVLFLAFKATYVQSLPLNNQAAVPSLSIRENKIQPKVTDNINEKLRILLKPTYTPEKVEASNEILRKKKEGILMRYFSDTKQYVKEEVSLSVQYRSNRIFKRELHRTFDGIPQSDYDYTASSRRSGLMVNNRRIRHSRKKFLEKEDRSGWGGGYG